MTIFKLEAIFSSLLFCFFLDNAQVCKAGDFPAIIRSQKKTHSLLALLSRHHHHHRTV